MKIYQSLEDFRKLANGVVTMGTFDGVHLGHLKIISRVCEVAQKNGGESVLLTFFPHPRMVLFSSNDFKLITTLDEKISLLEKTGLDHLIIQPFSKEFSRISSVEFVRDILVNLIGTKRLVIGYNHHFGRNREGSYKHLKQYALLYDFEVEEVLSQDVNNISVSSTKIRKALEQGKINKANKFLTYDFTISGQVIKGYGLGRKIMFPTANIEVKDENKLIPLNGVYGVFVDIRGLVFKGMLNIGYKPTLDREEKSIEVHVFNFNQYIYGETISVKFKFWHREEKKFDSLQSLYKQLLKDKSEVLSKLS